MRAAAVQVRDGAPNKSIAGSFSGPRGLRFTRLRRSCFAILRKRSIGFERAHLCI